MIIMLSAIAALLGVAWGGFWALVRDQGQPYYLPDDVKRQLEAEGKLFKKWKELGITQAGILFGGLVALYLGEVSVEAAGWAVGAGAMTAFWWSQGHKKGLDLSNPLDWLAMAGTGAGVTLGPAAALAWHGDVVLGAIVLAAGAAKCVTYWLGYQLRGRGDHPWPHATAIGAVLAGALAYGATAACMALA